MIPKLIQLNHSFFDCIRRNPTFLKPVRLAPNFTSGYDEFGLDIIPDFVDAATASLLVQELHPRLKKLDYLDTHWDQVITGYREFQFWPSEKSPRGYPACEAAFQRMTAQFFPPGHRVLGAHVLDYTPLGHVRAHLDSVEFAGPILAGLSLISPVVMRFKHQSTDSVFDAIIPANSVYLMSQSARYEFTHETPPPEDDFGKALYDCPRTGQRIAFIIRSDVNEVASTKSPWMSSNT